MEHIVSSCLDCPLFNDEYTACNHPKHERDESGNGECSEAWHNKTIPDFCPLNSEPITITKSN